MTWLVFLQTSGQVEGFLGFGGFAGLQRGVGQIQTTFTTSNIVGTTGKRKPLAVLPSISRL